MLNRLEINGIVLSIRNKKKEDDNANQNNATITVVVEHETIEVQTKLSELYLQKIKIGDIVYCDCYINTHVTELGKTIVFVKALQIKKLDEYIPMNKMELSGILLINDTDVLQEKPNIRFYNCKIVGQGRVKSNDIIKLGCIIDRQKVQDEEFANQNGSEINDYFGCIRTRFFKRENAENNKTRKVYEFVITKIQTR